jgi:hypothetical protein
MRCACTLNTFDTMDYGYLNAIRLSATFGEVESTGTSTRGMDGLFLSNSAVFPIFLWTGKTVEDLQPPVSPKRAKSPV